MHFRRTLKRRPLTAAIVVTGAKAAVADLMVQVLVEQREKVDVRRVALSKQPQGSEAIVSH